MIYTHSLFYYGFTVTESSRSLDFVEGGVSKEAVLDLGNNTFSTIASKVQTALNSVSENVYTVTGDRETRKFTISSSEPFDLPFATGANASTSVGSLLGFSGDLTGFSSYEGEAAGGVYAPQFKLQSFLSPLDNSELVSATINESTSGALEIVTFGKRRFFEFELKYITNRPQPLGGPIKNNSEGVESARAFMSFAIEKRPLEIMIDEDNKSVFETILLESTPSSGVGTSFRLVESFSDRPDYFESGLLRWRKL
jgi:hypothetical protein